MSFSIAFGPVSVADIQTAADAAYETWSATLTDPEIAEGGDPLSLASYRFNEDQRYMAREALRQAVDTVKRGNFGSEYGDAVDAQGHVTPADQVNVSVSGHGRRLAVRVGDSSATPSLTIKVDAVARTAAPVVAPEPVVAEAEKAPA